MADREDRSWLDIVLDLASAGDSMRSTHAVLCGRVVLYLRVQSFFLLAFFVLRAAMMWRVGIFAAADGVMLVSFVTMGTAGAVLAGLASYIRRSACSEERSRLLEGLSTLFVGVAIPLMTMGAPDGMRPELLCSFALTQMLMARAALVPSSSHRSAAIGAAAAVPTVVFAGYLAFAVPPPADLPDVFIRLAVPAAWSVACVALATLASHTIYRLRAQVREAMRVGPYRLVRKIGEGGMGQVYEARHALLRRPTAVKLLPADKAGAANLARFEREVQAASQLTHPNTVAIYDFGHTPEGTFYYAMEYIDGLSLEQLVAEEGPQPPGRVAHVLEQVALALAEAHERGLVHRDVKPANIMIAFRGGVPDAVKVVDFGLAKLLDDAGEANLTREGAVLGTPHYLAPETIAAPDTAGAGVDIYALGAVGYFLLTGATVFQGATIAAICADHLHSPPVAVTERTTQTVSPELAALIMSCLEKDPAARPQSARRLASALGACPDGWNEEEARAWWRRRGAEKRERAAGEADDKDAAPPIDLRVRERGA